MAQWVGMAALQGLDLLSHCRKEKVAISLLSAENRKHKGWFVAYHAKKKNFPLQIRGGGKV